MKQGETIQKKKNQQTKNSSLINKFDKPLTRQIRRKKTQLTEIKMWKEAHYYCPFYFCNSCKRTLWATVMSKIR